MEMLRDWASAMCALGIGCAVLKMLCPAGAMRRVFGVLTAVLFVCCLLSPLSAVIGGIRDVFALSEQDAVSDALSNTVNEQAAAIIEQALLEDARERVGDRATVRAVRVERDTSRHDSIYIEGVCVVFDCDDRPVTAATRRVLERAWGMEVEVIYDG